MATGVGKSGSGTASDNNTFFVALVYQILMKHAFLFTALFLV